ncbi:tyrosine-type recombinase/integrase [Desulfitobacterium chlororespirans]|uniref:Integrase/recombinase XerC n=1 Tax=Desulfitobacterium chlororespirans DSM 11544 TaxID=1121395 RepID=A0A1M7UYA3_9FIRM|nr:tyrosine-type recombinase/integrase [Desulfitobacterium chlororespirans]SHN87900.1 integrase/recombinase XerC [Desulfitobacterium chlororespirans DSM 11544]
MQKYLESYIYHISIERNLSKGTIGNYKKEIEAFMEFFKSKWPEQDIVYLCEHEEVIKKYLYKLVEVNKNKARTVNRKTTILRGFFNHLIISKEFPEIKSTPMLNIKGQKVEKTIPIFLSAEQCEQFLYGIKFFSRYATRDYAIFQVFLSTGARLTEIAKLELNQVNLHAGIIKLYGKGRKERLVALTESAAEALKLYLSCGDNKDPAKKGRVPKLGTNIVFLNKYGKPFDETGKGMYMLLIDLAKRSGIYKKGLSPHKLRHTFATLLLSNGCNIVELQKLLGHTSLNSTEIYTHILDEDMLNRVRSTHPLNKKYINDDFVSKIKNGKNK